MTLNVTPGQPVVMSRHDQPEIPAVVDKVWSNGVFTLAGFPKRTFRPDGMERGDGFNKSIIRLYREGETAETVIARNHAREEAAALRAAEHQALIDAKASAALRRNPDFMKDLVRLPATMIYAGTAMDSAGHMMAVTFFAEERLEHGWEAHAEPKPIHEIRFTYARIQRDGTITGWSSTNVRGLSLTLAIGRMLATLG